MIAAIVLACTLGPIVYVAIAFLTGIACTRWFGHTWGNDAPGIASLIGTFWSLSVVVLVVVYGFGNLILKCADVPKPR